VSSRSTFPIEQKNDSYRIALISRDPGTAAVPTAAGQRRAFPGILFNATWYQLPSVREESYSELEVWNLVPGTTCDLAFSAVGSLVE